MLIGYGSYSIDDRTDLNFQVDVGQNKNAGTRGIGFTSSAASSSYDSYTAHLGVGLGRTYSMTPKTNFTPSIRADYTVIKDEAYSETGAGSLNLSVDSRKFDQLILGTDARFTHYLSDRWTASANVGVGYDTMNSQAAITATFAGAPGASFVTYGLDQSPWLGRGGCGVTYKIKTSVELTGRYDAEVREGFTNQTASVKLRWLI
ncbi:MAG: autotransporter outer membrane beta-barrel domain-containing protein [Burkholderiales bacterium]|nr:autotransporter outer membrane beta-barrel domain-containing protein [Burkholderiales bacterium]